MDIIGIAQPIKDLILVVDRLPDENSYTSLLDYSSQGGGKVSTALVAASRLGMECAVAGTIGKDAKGKFVREDFIRHGIQADQLKVREEGKTGYCVCIAETYSPNRRFLGERPTVRQLTPSELDVGFLRQARVIHLETPDAVSIAAAEFAKSQGITVSMDADPYPEETGALIEMERLIDIYIGSEAYFKVRSKGKPFRDTLYEIAEKGCRVAAVTMGEQGVEAVIDGEYIHIPAFRKLPVADTTGAGDVFHGAFLSAWIKGLEPRQCLLFASAASAIKCTGTGGRAGIPDWDMTNHFLETGELLKKETIRERELFYKNLVI
ncbi:carbohydrate kinase family protein [Diplocloster hominis]|uniref:carbohydrate kinase family protein n=1 Tax=Diplocloster hominis TaxID=3079010 RepID=UPI0031BB1CF9